MILWLLACEAAPVAPPQDAPEPVVADEPPPKPQVLADPVFNVAVEPLSAELRASMTGVSWREGCPVGFDDLVLIRSNHHDFEGGIGAGQLIVAKDHAAVVVDVLRRAFAEKFPIERMEPVHRYGGDDTKSMVANNTSAFNCRAITGGRRYSEHAYGHAIDINPLRNPYISRSGKVQPAEGKAFIDREATFVGKISAEGVVVKAFADHGWGWGGSWSSSKDYQHFSVNGR